MTTKTSIYSERGVCSHFWLPLKIYVCSLISINLILLKIKCHNNVVSSHIGILRNSLLMSHLAALISGQIKTLCKFDYIIWIFRHLNYFKVIKMYAENSQRRRNTSKIRLCCYNGECWDNFKDLPQRIESLSGKPLLEFIHKSPTGMLINKVPKGKKWNDYLYDFWDYQSQCDFDNEFTTTMDVNCFGNDKIYINWRVLDRYKGHYKTHNLTRNMVDIKVYIPD